MARESIECYNAGDFDRLRSLLADDFYEEELATRRRLEGADARIEAAQSWKRAFPNEHGTITGATTSGNTVAIELTWEGTQRGPMATPGGQELPPSNKRMTVKSVEVIEIEDGKIKALRHYFDLMTILQQIGGMEPAGTAVASRLLAPRGTVRVCATIAELQLQADGIEERGRVTVNPIKLAAPVW